MDTITVGQPRMEKGIASSKPRLEEIMPPRDSGPGAWKAHRGDEDTVTARTKRYNQHCKTSSATKTRWTDALLHAGADRRQGVEDLLGHGHVRGCAQRAGRQQGGRCGA